MPTEQDGGEREERRDRIGRVLAQVDILTGVPLSTVHALFTTGLSKWKS